MPSMVTVIPLRQRAELCAFFARQFEIEWPGWYGPNGKADAAADLKDFANPAGELPVRVVALDQLHVPTQATSWHEYAHGVGSQYFEEDDEGVDGIPFGSYNEQA